MYPIINPNGKVKPAKIKSRICQGKDSATQMEVIILHKLTKIGTKKK